VALSRSQITAYYDRFGAKQDTQAFYEDAALDRLIAHADFESADSVFELGCGTGRFASRLLSKHLRSSATYLGVDLSRTMVNLAEQRIAPYAERANVVQTDGSMRFPAADHSVDRVVSTYVFDLLSESVMRKAISESRRVLSPDGRLCLVSLTSGTTFISKIVSATWSLIYRLHAQLVGGCRPIRLEELLGRRDWSIDYTTVVTRWGIPSEVLVATPVDVSS
jgi:ubiquinone/menaquinone biosynthesis C-methylase UbiE